MAEEVELKLVLRRADVAAVTGLLGGEPTRIEQVATYYDTPDRALANAGMSLRIRTAQARSVQTIKSRAHGAAGLFARGEWECDVAAGAPPVIDAASPIAAALRDRPDDLLPLFTVAVERLVWQKDVGGTLIEIALDSGEVSAAGRRADLCEIELELKRGEPGALFALARRIDVVAPVRLGVLTKADRGYRLLDAASGAAKAAPLVLANNTSAADAFQAAAFACIHQFRLNEMVLANGPSNAALHQARVALRRLRSAMSIWRPIVDDPVGRRLAAELRWLSGVLGEARNLDVLIDRIAAGEVRDRLVAQRGTAYAAVAAALASSRSRATMLALAEWIATGTWLTAPPTQSRRDLPAVQFASHTLARLRRKVKRRGRDLATATDEERHELRKDAKKLRYAAEFFASLFARARRHRRFVNALARLQDELGALNDLATAETVLDEHAIDPAAAGLLPSGHDKPSRIRRAASAHAALVDAKRFWHRAASLAPEG